MKNIINFIIKEDDNNKRVDTILANHDKRLSRTRVKNLILDSKLKINEKIIKDPSVKTKLNDKIDLAQAESVADLIAAQTSSALVAASSSLSGAFSALVNKTIDGVVGVRVVVGAGDSN